MFLCEVSNRRFIKILVVTILSKQKIVELIINLNNHNFLAWCDLHYK